MIMKLKYVLFLLAVIITRQSSGQTVSLERQINQIIDTVEATVGVAISSPKEIETILVNQTERYPMQSVFKFPLAVTVLSMVDQKKLSMKQKVPFTKNDYIPNTWSPMAKKYPNGSRSLTVEDLLNYTLSNSDNNGCDILFKLIGGPEVVDEYLKKIGIKDIAIVANEAAMHSDPEIQYKNWSTPLAMVELLQKSFDTPILSRESKDFLWKAMAATITGGKRIKGLLPAGTIVAHRTGTSGRDSEGKTAATNDVGIIVLPDESKIIIAILIKDSDEEPEINEKIMARIAKVTYDFFKNKE